MTKLEAALSYASWGWAVLPVVPNGKVPATQHGVNDATTDVEKIKGWWEQNPDYNIGVAVGNKSGIVVFDVDPRNGGDLSWESWTEEYGNVPEGICQETAGGGYHYVAAYNEEIRSCKLQEGIDLLSDGRYFIVYPSTINERTYTWDSEGDPFEGVAPFVIPELWVEGYRTIKKAPKQTPDGMLIKGNRNNGLTALGGTMRRYGMSSAEIAAALSIANETRCEVPLPFSELQQIIRSVSRYEPEFDVAADVAVGSDVADAILAASRAKTQDYFFTRASSFLSQPSPIKWVVKHWIPDLSVSMIYGDSSVGKTFIALDIACHIATGRDWFGNKTKSGMVVYMAGEGNYGIRQRVASWCKEHKVSSLDNLIISNKAIDIDDPTVASQIINAIKEVTDQDAVMIFIDTMANHLAGHENDSKDFRAFLNSCNIVARALNSSIGIIHHVGHGVDAKDRARGTSSMRGAMDAMMFVQKTSGIIEISCAKMKDAEEPVSLYGELKKVDLGWKDDDGCDISGAVFVMKDKKDIPVKEIKSDYQVKLFENAWLHSGRKRVTGRPFITRDDAINYLLTIVTPTTAEAYVKPSSDKFVGRLLNERIIVPFGEGWHIRGNIRACYFDEKDLNGTSEL